MTIKKLNTWLQQCLYVYKLVIKLRLFMCLGMLRKVYSKDWKYMQFMPMAGGCHRSTLWVKKKHATPGSGITLANADKFLKFFHCGLGNKSQQEPCYTPNASRACKRSKIAKIWHIYHNNTLYFFNVHKIRKIKVYS